MKPSITAIVLTYNEELNLPRCLSSIKDFADEIIIIDSFSADNTKKIGESFGAKIYEREFKHQADQFNWAVDNLPIKNEWILRLDADEYLTEELKKEIAEKLPGVPESISGFFMKRRVYFMGRWIRHGGYYPTWLLRLFRKGKARSEYREVDEHIIILEGKSAKLKNDFVDDNQKPLENWIAKHNNYSTRETRERMSINSKFPPRKTEQDSPSQERGVPVTSHRSPVTGSPKRWIKDNLYSKAPLFFRSFCYFIYRYVFRLGFLDGREGLIFHFLQGYWHQFLVDAKIYERLKKEKIEEFMMDKIKIFWNKKPCGTSGFTSDNLDIFYFNKIKERRYKTEPFTKNEIIYSDLREKKVLEIGCGIGTDGLEITKITKDYTGIDVSENSLRLAKKNFRLNNISANLLLADAENLPFPDNSFDFIYSWGVLHHTPDITKAISEVYRVLKPGGHFCIMVYNRYSLVGLQLYILHGLLKLKPFIHWEKLFAKHHESPGTKAFTNRQSMIVFQNFKEIKIKNIVTPYDVRISHHRYLPNFFQNFIPSKFGFFKVIRGIK